jgi:hypothetical protein
MSDPNGLIPADMIDQSNHSEIDLLHGVVLRDFPGRGPSISCKLLVSRYFSVAVMIWHAITYPACLEPQLGSPTMQMSRFDVSRSSLWQAILRHEQDQLILSNTVDVFAFVTYHE